MTLVDILSCTRMASWSDKKFHRQCLEKLLEMQGVASIKKAYLLGYAAANPLTINHIDACIEQKSAWALRQIFQRLPHGEDELGLTVIGPMCSVCLIIEPNNRLSVAVIGNPRSLPASEILLLFRTAKDFPYGLVLGKRLIIEQAYNKSAEH